MISQLITARSGISTPAVYKRLDRVQGQADACLTLEQNIWFLVSPLVELFASNNPWMLLSRSTASNRAIAPHCPCQCLHRRGPVACMSHSLHCSHVVSLLCWVTPYSLKTQIVFCWWGSIYTKICQPSSNKVRTGGSSSLLGTDTGQESKWSAASQTLAMSVRKKAFDTSEHLRDVLLLHGLMLPLSFFEVSI